MKKTHKRAGLALSLTQDTLVQVKGSGMATSPVVANGVITSPDGVATTPGLCGLGSSPE